MPKQKESTINDLSQKIDDLARMTATELAALRGEMVTKQELHTMESSMRKGFSLVMETLQPMRHDYESLKDDLAPRMNIAEARLTKVERKVGM